MPTMQDRAVAQTMPPSLTQENNLIANITLNQAQVKAAVDTTMSNLDKLEAQINAVLAWVEV